MVKVGMNQNMNLKICVVIGAFIMALPLISATQYANGYTWTYQIKDNTAEIYGYYDSARGRWVSAITPEPVGPVAIPSTLGGRPVTSIGELAFLSCREMTELTIPDVVTNIGRDAFDACVGLASLTIPKSVTNIADSAFVFCTGLKSISVDSGNEIYKSMNGLLLTKDGHQLINGVNGGDVKIPAGVVSINSEAFYGCEGLTSVSLPDSVTYIGSSAFYGCSGLTNVTFGINITNIGDSVFAGCGRLKCVDIPDGVISIGESSFSGCYGLANVVIPDGVTSIKSRAFEGCYGLTNVVIGSGVKSIGEGAFAGCSSSLFDLTTFLGLKLLDGWVVGNTGGLSGDLDLKGVRGVADRAFYGCRELTSVVLPNSMTTIGENMFYNCSELRSVMIPDTVTDIGGYAFNKCSKLTSVTIPDSVTSIGLCAFEDCTSISTVTIGTGVTNIGVYTFSGCSRLASVTIGSSVRNIESYAFQDCSGLRSVIIPDSVTSIESYAFDRCSSLTSVTIPASVTHIGTFRDCSNLSRVYLPKGLPVSNSTFPTGATLYRYSPSQVVVLDPNGGTCARQAVEVAYGKAYGELPVPERLGCVFGGWMIGGASVSSNTVVSSLDDHELVAQWKCEVVFDVDGGVCETSSRIVKYGAPIGTLPNPTREKAAFLGWFTEVEGGAKVDAALKVTDGMTLYAHWLFEVTTPVITANGAVEFRMDSCEVTITSATEGAKIYYTDDGTTPKKSDDYLYSGPILITETTTFKAIAVVDSLSSGYVTVTITKRPISLEEALGVGDAIVVATSEEHPWMPILDPSVKEGGLSVRSGVIGNGTSTWLSASVSGGGTMIFRCKSSCEHDDDDAFTWDRLMVFTNGVEITDWRMDGETDWTERTLIFGGGENTVRWVYYKDNSYAEGEDCAWVSSVKWTPDNPFPDVLSDNDVVAALAGSVDPSLSVKISDVPTYSEFREWALKIGAAEVKASPFAWVSFAMDSAVLLMKRPTDGDLKVEEFKPSATAGSFDFTVSVKDVTIGDNASEDNLKKLFGLEGAESLDSDAFASENVLLDFKEPQDGKLKFTATPAVDNAKSFFMKVKIK